MVAFAPSRPALTDLAAATAGIVSRELGSCSGACLGTSAVLAFVLGEYGIGTEAVSGTYRGESHWWLEADGLIIDPTRPQFDDGSPVLIAGEDDAYAAGTRYASLWDEQEAMAEFARMFTVPSISITSGRAVLGEVRAIAAGCDFTCG